ncbi:hypothetical protein BT69DRAFT_1333887 [Atractiella rhizophila]|nr:hypothetical protein BT69DRAFT_1333887 [Atractiella rhizophila]
MDSASFPSFRLKAFLVPLPSSQHPSVNHLSWEIATTDAQSRRSKIGPFFHDIPSRETDKNVDVTYIDHFRIDLDILPLTIKAAFWETVVVWNVAERLERTANFVEDLQVFLQYMYPARASAPPMIVIDRDSGTSFDIVRIKSEEHVLMTLVLLPSPSLVAEDWEDYDSLDKPGAVARNWASFLTSLSNNSDRHQFCAILDFKSSVIFRESYNIKCAFEPSPYFQVLALLSEVFSRKWDTSKFSNQTGPACFPHTQVLGCARDPKANCNIDISSHTRLSDFDLYDIQTYPTTFQDGIPRWHRNRVEAGACWLDSLDFADAEVVVMSVLSTTDDTVFPPLLASATNEMVQWHENILFHATQSVRPSPVSFTALQEGSRIKLLRSLRSGEELHGQTFLVRVEGETSPLVLKIYDERLFPYPAWDRDGPEMLDLHLRRWPDADVSMEKELTAYSTLRLLQGSTIPRSYGFYSVQLSDGTVAKAHLMEFVDGPCLHEADVRNLPDAGQQAFFTKGMIGIAAIYLLGIVHGDLVQRPDQLICPSTSPDQCPDVVILDFGMASEVRMDDSTLLADLAWDISSNYDSSCMLSLLADALCWQNETVHPELGLTGAWTVLRTKDFGYHNITWGMS